MINLLSGDNALEKDNLNEKNKNDVMQTTNPVKAESPFVAQKPLIPKSRVGRKLYKQPLVPQNASTQTVQASGAQKQPAVGSPKPPPPPPGSVLSPVKPEKKEQEMSILRKGRGLSINLVPEDTMRVVREELPDRLKYLVLFVILSIAFVFSIWAVISWLSVDIFSEIRMKNAELNQTKLDIMQFQTDSTEVTKLRDRYNVVKYLLGKHIYWTKFFELLEKYTIEEVYYDGFSLQSQENASLTFGAHAKTVYDLARQIKAYEAADDFCDEVSVNGYTVSSGQENDVIQKEITFSIRLRLVPDVFYKVPQ